MLAAQSLTVADVVAGHARTCPDREAVVCGGHRTTFQQLEMRANQLARALGERGVVRGDRVLWLGRNCHVVIELFLACSKVGAMLCPVNWRSSFPERSFVIDDLRPRVVVYDDLLLGVDAQKHREATDDDSILWIPTCDYEQVLAAEPPSWAMGAEVDASDPALVLYTGAFHGQPSGSMLTHTNLLAQSILWMYFWSFDERTVYLACGPLFHVAAWMSVVPALHIGGKVVVTEQAEVEEICRVIERERCTHGLILPPTIEKILAANADRRYDLSSFRSFVRMPVWDDMVAQDESPMGRSPGGYGQTEVTGSAIVSALGPRPADLTAGVPSPAATIRLVDEDGDEVPDGDVGEIVARGPVVHAGYWNRPDVNAARFRDGWWHTGDLGRHNADGSISFIGPKRRMIKSAMENIYPAEVELCLEQHDAVREAAVIGVPDDRWIQSVRAIVAVDAGVQVGESEIIDWCRARLASYKKPRSVVFVDALPRHDGAKDYDELDRAFGGGGYPGGDNAHIPPGQGGTRV